MTIVGILLVTLSAIAFVVDAKDLLVETDQNAGDWFQKIDLCEASIVRSGCNRRASELRRASSEQRRAEKRHQRGRNPEAGNAARIGVAISGLLVLSASHRGLGRLGGDD